MSLFRVVGGHKRDVDLAGFTIRYTEGCAGNC